MFGKNVNTEHQINIYYCATFLHSGFNRFRNLHFKHNIASLFVLIHQQKEFQTKASAEQLQH